MKVKIIVLVVLLAVLSIVIEDVSCAQVKKSGHLARNNRNRNNKNKNQRQKERKRNRRRRRKPKPSPQPCPPVPHVADGSVVSRVGNRAMFACRQGYSLAGTNIITCVNGVWTVLPRCVKDDPCTSPPPFVPFAGPAVLTSGGTTAMYTCLPNYRVVNGNGATVAQAQCNTVSGMWTNLPACEAIPVEVCGSPPSIANAASTLSSNGQMATYACNTGYTLLGNAVVVCTNAQWPSTGLPSCNGISPLNTTCGNVPGGDQFAIRASIVADSFSVGSTVAFNCIAGYRVVGGNDNTNTTGHIYCLEGGSWSLRPTCEPVVCGNPPAGVQTVDVSTTCITYECTYTYVCNTGYEHSGSLTTTCMTDGMWSLPAPTCTQQMCLASALPTLTNGSPSSTTNFPVGTVVTYTCNPDYRVAPSTPGTLLNTQTVTCQAGGTYTALTHSCVYKDPTDCKDYFRRDNLWGATGVGTCATVTLDPQGPGLTNIDNPPPFVALCCKSSTTECCTELAPVTGATVAPDGALCAALTTTIWPGAVAAGDLLFCNAPTVVGYGLTDVQIASMISSTNGSCSQQVTIDCLAGTFDNFPLVQCNGDAIGTGYGTNVDATSLTTGVLDPFPWHGLGGRCDCSTGAIAATGECLLGGCNCVVSDSTNALAAASQDTITKDITPRNLAWVTHHQMGTLAGATVAGTWSGVTSTVGSIVCCDTI